MYARLGSIRGPAIGGLVAALAALGLVADASGAPGRRAFVRCETRSGRTAPAFKPHACVFVVAGAHVPPFGFQQTFIKNLRWRHWGAPATTATGTFRGNMNVVAPVTVRLSGLRACAGTRTRTYRLFRVTFHRAGYPPARTVKITGCG